MLHFENCRTFNNHYDYTNKMFLPSDILIGTSICNIDYSYNALYWIDRLNETQFATATDRGGKTYKIYHNTEKNLITAIPD